MQHFLARPLLIGLITALASTASIGTSMQAQLVQASATLWTQEGEQVGTVTFTQQSGTVMVMAVAASLSPGFHGFHVHTAGICDPSTQFMSAGGHLNPEMSTHRDHAGDMTSLHVNGDGTSMLMFTTDRFTVADLLADGGRAVIVHADPDNFANIPSRYGVTLDETTLGTGDAGARVACGMIQAS
jgi:Cu-Zn family superoxide dismutase